jgi:lantibiotic modifying enzyme
LQGLHFGEAGVAVAIAEAVAAGLIDGGIWLDEYLKEALAGPVDWPDVTHGAAGQGIAVLACADLLKSPKLSQLAHRCAQYLLTSQDADGGWTLPEGVEEMTGVRYTGFAHGTAGIVYFLCEYAALFEHSGAVNAARLGAEWLVHQGQPARSGMALYWPTQVGGDEVWRWWCHGAPGIALSFLKLFELTADERYANIAQRALYSHPIDVRYSNLSQCHGLSGLGEIYLEASRVLGERRWLDRAERIGNVLLQLGRQASGGVTWLVEDPFSPTADLMVGCGGVAHFLLRLAGGRKVSHLGPPLLLSPNNKKLIREGEKIASQPASS